jgi:predicted nucleic acid-binding protein
MIVVSDTSPISSLFLINQLSLLPAIFGQIIVPEMVWQELLILESRFGHDLSEMKSAPWLRILPVRNHTEVIRLQKFLDAGESQAIILAKELHADYLLIDEMEGREVAAQEGLKTIGILGVFIQAKEQGLIAEVRPLMEDLKIKARFHIHENLFKMVLLRAGEL